MNDEFQVSFLHVNQLNYLPGARDNFWDFLFLSLRKRSICKILNCLISLRLSFLTIKGSHASKRLLINVMDPMAKKQLVCICNYTTPQFNAHFFLSGEIRISHKVINHYSYLFLNSSKYNVMARTIPAEAASFLREGASIYKLNDVLSLWKILIMKNKGQRRSSSSRCVWQNV